MYVDFCRYFNIVNLSDIFGYQPPPWNIPFLERAIEGYGTAFLVLSSCFAKILRAPGL
jgi:hypothetical protein